MFRIAAFARHASAARLCAARFSQRLSHPVSFPVLTGWSARRALSSKKGHPTGNDAEEGLDAFFDKHMQAKINAQGRITPEEVIELLSTGKDAEARRRMDELTPTEAAELEEELKSYRDRVMSDDRAQHITGAGGRDRLVEVDGGKLALQRRSEVQFFQEEERQVVPDDEAEEEELLVKVHDGVVFADGLLEDESSSSSSSSEGTSSSSSSESDGEELDEDGLTAAERADFDAIEQALEEEMRDIVAGRRKPDEAGDVDEFLRKVAPPRKGGLRSLDDDEDDADDEGGDELPDISEEDVKEMFGDPYLVATRTTYVSPEDRLRGRRASFVQQLEPFRDDSRAAAPNAGRQSAAPPPGRAKRPQKPGGGMPDIDIYRDEPQLYGKLHKLQERERKRGERLRRRAAEEARRRRRKGR